MRAATPAGPAARSSEDHARRLKHLGWWIVAGAVAPVAAWMVLAPLSMAVVAPAYVKVDLNRRPVQHLEGGLVRSVLVRDGQQVKAGEPVLVLGDVGVEADRNRIEYRVHIERAALARLDAEQQLAARLSFPRELLEAARRDERVRQALVKEKALFDTRRDSLASEIALMRSQREHVGHEIDALRAQIRQAEGSLGLQRRVYQANEALMKDGFIARARLEQLQGAVLDYESKLEQQRSELARAGQRKVEIELRIRSAQNQYAQAASDQVKTTLARLGEIEQEQRKSEDAAKRQVVVAPASGEVIDLKFTSPGAVVRPGEPIAEIVPSEARLMIEAHIRPEDINNVHREQHARIKFMSFKYRNAILATGQVAYVSGDRLIDRVTNLPYYTALIAVDPESLHAGVEVKLQAGMPAEVYIEGIRQTPLQYLAEPIRSTLRKAGRQM